MDHRRLLYFDSTGTFDVRLSALSASGWQVETANDLRRARGLAETGRYRVGLVRLSSQQLDLCGPQAEEFFFDQSAMRWIALVSKEQMDEGEVCEAVSDCFWDYHVLPADSERLQVTLGHALGMAELARTVARKHNQTAEKYGLVGSSRAMRNLIRDIEKVAGTDAPVLITGESGTGKELAARAMHRLSDRSGGAFVAVNCAALPASLIQAEMFGYEKGAFTGARERKIGRIEAAAGGTIFLDEIADLTPDLQVTLLRFLQEKTIERLGGSEPIHVDARVIAATHVDLERAVATGQFREDLYYRLHVLHVQTPSLRERNGDIERLARFFFQTFVKERRRDVQGFSQAALNVMRRYDWPGNVRELMNRVRRASVMCESCLISPADLGLERRTRVRRVMTLDDARAVAEKEAIVAALQYAGDNITQAAEDLGVSRGTLYRLMQKHNVPWSAAATDAEDPPPNANHNDHTHDGARDKAREPDPS